MTSSGDHSSHSFDTLQSSTSDQEGTSDGPDEAVMFSSSSSDEVEEFNVLHPHLTRKILQARKKRPKHSAYVFALGAILTTAFTTMFCSAEDQISGTSLSTGVVLVALGLPSLLVKLFLMFQRLPQIPSIFGCFVFLLLGLALNLSSVLLTRVVGLCMVSLGTGLGEVNVHAGINAEMTKKAYSTFLGGTGVAGVLGGLVYVGLTNWAPVDPRTVTVLSALWPVTVLLTSTVLEHKLNRGARRVGAPRDFRWSALAARGRVSSLQAVRGVLHHLWLLFVTSFSVYISLGAVLTTVVLSDVGDAPEYSARGHFLHFVLSTLVGEFLGRAFMSMLCSLAPGFHFVASPLLALLLVSQVVFYVISAWCHVMPYLWVYWLMCFVMGTTSGLIYVNSVHAITNTVTPTRHQLLLTCATAAESAGLFIAGLLGFFVEPALQEHCLSTHRVDSCLARSADPDFWMNGRL